MSLSYIKSNEQPFMVCRPYPLEAIKKLSFDFSLVRWLFTMLPCGPNITASFSSMAG